ncbi:hypothetical protein D3C73_1376630 [compost metagenome]
MYAPTAIPVAATPAASNTGALTKPAAPISAVNAARPAIPATIRVAGLVMMFLASFSAPQPPFAAVFVPHHPAFAAFLVNHQLALEPM